MMKSIRTKSPQLDWQPGSPISGREEIFKEKGLVDYKQHKILSDRRAEGGGLAFISRTTPPPGKLVRIVAKAESDEHVFILEGGGYNNSGKQISFPGDYIFNPRGKIHSGIAGGEVIALVVYVGEPDSLISLEVVDIDPPA